jgi:chromosomal replication initiation ATPase DnaA
MKLSKMVEVSDLERLDNDNKEDIINDNNAVQQNENKSNISKTNEKIGNYIGPIGLNPKYTFENYIVGSNNRFAHASAIAVSENPGEKYNPLFIYGGVGLGKTHLMQAIGHGIYEQNPNFNVIYTTGENFANELVSAIMNNSSENFRNKYRRIDLLLIDDIGAEKVTEWSRDEILGTVLQERMNNYKTTFFTSNFNIQELEKHLANDGDIVKARRIVERIKQLSDDLEMNSENRRK